MSPHASPTSYVLAASPRYDRTYGTPIRPARLRRADVCPLCPGMPLVDDARYASSAPRCVKLSFRRPLAYRRPLSCHPSLVAALAPWFDSSSDAHPGREVRGGLTIIGKARKPILSPLCLLKSSALASRPSSLPHNLPATHHQDTHIRIIPPTTSTCWPHLHPICYLIYVCLYGRSQAGAKSSLFRPLPPALFPPLTLCILSSVFTSLCHHHLFYPPCFPFPPRLWPLVLSRSPFYRAPSSPNLPHTRHRFACGWGRTVRKGRGARSCCLESRLLPPSHTSSPPLRCESFRSGHSTISTPSRRRIYPPFPLFLFSLFPVPLTHRIDNQSRPRPSIPYTVRRDKRENERRQHRIRYIRDRPRIVHYTHPDSSHGRSIIRIYRPAYILSHTVLCWVGVLVSELW